MIEKGGEKMKRENEGKKEMNEEERNGKDNWMKVLMEGKIEVEERKVDR
jgi:hypothetical protein